MRCFSCRADNPDSSRFCAGCGARLGMAPAPSSLAFETVCVHCGERTHALPYFSRGWNVAKGVVLLPLTTLVGPLLFFMLRRDRVICAHCRSLLPGEAHVPMLSAFTATPVVPPMGMLPAGPGSEHTSIAPATRGLLWKSRVARAQAWIAGLASTGFAAGALGEWNRGFEDMAAPGAFAAFFASISVFALRRSGRARTRAAELESRERTLKLLDLARNHAGRLTVPLVASELRLDLQEAERALDATVDGRNVDLQINEDGQVFYLFRGLPALPGQIPSK